jgi:hypothetical protein
MGIRMVEFDKHKHDEQTEDLYAAIGRFAVEFEHICNYMRIIIGGILCKEGLHNNNVIEILLSDLNAAPLRSLVSSLISETVTLSESDLRIVTRILNDVQKMTEKRNEVIHATWYIGWMYNEENESKVAPGVKYKKGKSGVATKRYDWTADDFNNLAQDASKLWGLLADLNRCIIGNYKVEDVFTIDEDGSISRGT